MYGLVSYWLASDVRSRIRPAGEQKDSRSGSLSEFEKQLSKIEQNLRKFEKNLAK